VDNLRYWQINENEFSELSASQITNLDDDEQIDLILRFYLQALLNKAYKIAAPEKENELVFVKSEAFDRTDALSSVSKYVNE
jgi:hypothetical protein